MSRVNRLPLGKGALALALTLLLALVPSTATAGSVRSPAPVPAGFAGVVLGAPLFPNVDTSVDLDNQLDLMVSSGVQSMRVPIDWASVQPYKDWSLVPADQQSEFVDAGGVPTNFTLIDQIVAEAARRGLTLMPVILDAPAWDGVTYPAGVVKIPRSDAPYASFVAALVRRYGPHGTFWQTFSPMLPVRMWQIWNEPNIIGFWPPQPFQRRYVGLLKAAHDAIKRLDPGAKVVLAGLPNYSWLVMKRIYKIPGARRLFDVVAVHPYTKTPHGVITILGYVRQTMNQAGDSRKPIVADEVSWPSSLGKTTHNVGYDFATTEAGQARNIGQLLPMLGKYRSSLRLQGFYYYTWASVERRNGLAFDFAGLLKFVSGQFIAKPALGAFTSAALALERCRRKGASATACLQAY